MPINLSTLDNQFRFRPALNGGGLRTKIFPEAASADFRYGEPVMISNSGGIASVTQMQALPGAGARSAAVIAGNIVLGFALANSTGVAGTPVPILLAQGCEVLTRVNTGTAGTSELQDVNVGDLCDIFRQRAATGPDCWMVVVPNVTPTTTKVVITEKYSPNHGLSANPVFQGEQAATDTYALVWVGVRPSLSVQGQ